MKTNQNITKKIIFDFLLIAVFIISLAGCKKLQDEVMPCPDHNDDPTIEYVPEYTDMTEFIQAMYKVDSMIRVLHIDAFLDTLPDGYPVYHGNKIPLSEISGDILGKLYNNEIASAINDIYHFDGSTFSLISYIMKAAYVSDLSYEDAAAIIDLIPVPPIQADGYTPPEVPKIVPVVPVVCVCKPKVKLFITMAVRPPCGNSETYFTGWAAGNKLNNMKTHEMYKIEAEITGCAHGGTWTNSQTTDIAHLAVSENAKGNAVTIFAESSGTFTITFTYKCNCNGNMASETFNLNF